MHAGINLEFARSEKLSLDEAMLRAAEAGYRFVEPYVYSPVSVPINSHLAVHTVAPYYHLDVATVDVPRLNRLRKDLGLRFSALDAHTTLLMPQIGVPFVRRAIDLAAEVECPVVMSDEGPVPEDWMPLECGIDILSVSLDAIVAHARSHGVRFAIELHNALTARPDLLAKLLARFGPEDLGVNFDTGNAFLAGNDPVAYVRRFAARVVHVHIKDIPASQVHERGSVTGTRVGVAAGDGVVDLPGVVAVLAEFGYQGVLSVECNTVAQAERSLRYLQHLRSSREPCPKSP
jgi:sugar phosphate isomerase/epimerase